MPKRTTQEEFIKRCKLKFPRLDFSKTVYNGCSNKIKAICPKHGEFEITANNLLHNSALGCPQCGIDLRRLTQESFINQATEKFGVKFDYSKTIIKTSKSDIIIICPIHGEFVTNARAFIDSSYGCPKCYRSGDKPYDYAN